MQVMHISAASEINNLLLPSLEMLRARPIPFYHPTYPVYFFFWRGVTCYTRSIA